MISLSIRNCPDKNTRTLIKDASWYFIAALVPNIRNLSVCIRLSKTLLKEEKISGSCGPEDFPVKKRYHDFTILIENSLPDLDKLSILAHEFAHVKQYSTGELVQDAHDTRISIWKGKRYNDEKLPYEKHPWEKDAVKLEGLLLDEYLKVTGVQVK